MSTSVTSVAARSRGGAVSLLTAGILWGTGGLAGTMLAESSGLHPLSVAAYRLVLGGGFVMLFLAATGGLRDLPRTRAATRRVLVAGALLAWFQASYFAAVSLTSVSIATMTTIGSSPVFVAVGSAVLDRRRPGARTIASVVGAVAGLVLLTWSPGDAGDRWQLLGGLVMALSSGAGFAALTLVNRTRVEGLDPLRTTAFGLVVGGVLLAPFALAFGVAVPWRVDVLAVALYFGAVPTALAYVAYFRGLRDSHPVLAALASLLEPLTAALLAAVVLGDWLGVTGWCGAALLVSAIAISYWRPRR